MPLQQPEPEFKMPTVTKISMISRGNIDEVAEFIKSLLKVALVGAVTKEEAFHIAKDTLARYIGVDAESIADMRTSVETADMITEAVKICSNRLNVQGNVAVTGCGPSIIRDDKTDAKAYIAKGNSGLTASFVSRSGDPVFEVDDSAYCSRVLDALGRMVYFGHTYVAQDSNGDWRSFSDRPTLNRNEGVWRLECKTDDSRYVARDAWKWPTGWADSLHHVVATTNVPRVVELIKVAD
jgi:hypothetical protein